MTEWSLTSLQIDALKDLSDRLKESTGRDQVRLTMIKDDDASHGFELRATYDD